MTVRELIEKLKKMPQDAQVRLEAHPSGNYWNFMTGTEIEVSMFDGDAVIAGDED